MAFATPALLAVFKKTGGLVWKRTPMNHTRRANAKERHRRIQQVEEVIRVCSQPPPAGQAEQHKGQAAGTSKATH